MKAEGNPSSCAVEILRKDNSLYSLKITLFGAASQFPSTSNSREIRYKWSFSRKTGHRCRLPFLAKSKYQHDRLALISAYYTQALLNAGAMPPSFGDELVTVLVTLGKHRSRIDSHNFCKPIGDWLQHAGVYNNDTRAEIFCRKAGDYGEPDDRTEIYVVRREETEPFTRALYSRTGSAES